VRVAFGSLGNRWPFPEPAEGRFDLVLANTSAATVILLGRELVGSLAPGGLLAAGGIIQSREEAAREAIAQAGGTITDTLRNGEWCTLLVTRRDP
jgi:ribosomal protein L11 methylase PrmA